MPAKRTKAKPRRGQITEADAQAFIAGDGLALHRALGLKPWQWSPSQTAKKCRTVEEVMANRETIEAEWLAFEEH